MKKRLSVVDGALALQLPSDWLEKYGFPAEVELEECDGYFVLRPVSHGLSFEAAADQLFEEKAKLIGRLSNA